MDPYGIFSSSMAIQRAWLNHPIELSEQFTKLTIEAWSLEEWQALTGFGLNGDLFPAVSFDERFQDKLWEKNPWFDTLKESYLLYTRWLEDAIYDTPDMEDKEKRKAAFWARQMLNAMAPTNFFWTNPKAIIRSMETNGTSLIEGWKNFLADVERGTVSMVKEDAFVIGKDLATTPGSVVFRNELLELIQYKPSTAKVHAIPIVIVTPWINKYYILDLDEKKSMIKYLVEQGFTVFITSWKNPGSEMRDTTLDDYMIKGVLEAVYAARDICAAPHVHLSGYCIGGTIVSALMAWLNHPDNDKKNKENFPVAHWTLLASLVDFSNPGEIDVFIGENAIQAVEKLMKEKGYLDGQDMAMSFRMLRSNSLIWHYFANNYLCGEEPEAFDVLFWNMDTTRMPEAMHKFYLRELYLNNRLVQKDSLIVGGRSIDLGRITQPLYSVGTEQDHIVPWKESFKTSDLVSGSVRYVLATSGHILGIVSPPVDPPKRRYWVSDVEKGNDVDNWLEETEKVPGSWWEDWIAWLAPQSGKKQKPPALGGKKHSRLADAPGTYVLEK